MNKKFLKNRGVRDLAYTLGANFVTLLSGLVSTFVLAMIWKSTDWYGYAKTFTLYLGYVGFFHFGFNDGIYINYGKYDYETLPREKFRAYFKFLTWFQIIIATILGIVACITTKDINRISIDIFLCMNIILVNLTCYFEFICQIVRKFKFYSKNMVISKILYILSVLGLVAFRNNSTDYNKLLGFMFIQTVINLVILVIYIREFKEINFGKSIEFKQIKDDIKKNINVGFFIMLGNFVSIIIIGVDRIVIDNMQKMNLVFTMDDMAMYSFAVSLLSMVYVIINGIKSVAYPYLTRSKEEDLGKNYMNMKTVIFILLGYCLSAYFIFVILITKGFPKFIPALSITVIIFPSIVISGEINIVTCNYYKILKLKKEYTKNSIVAVTISLITIAIAVACFKSMEAIAMSSLISFFLWGIYGDRFFEKSLKINTRKHHIAQLLTIILFLVMSRIELWYVAMVIYILVFTLIVIVIFGKDILRTYKKMKQK